jgi:hypothetical protein
LLPVLLAAVALHLATQSVILAAVGNSMLRGGFALALGSPALRRQVALVLGLTILAGPGSLWLVR